MEYSEALDIVARIRTQYQAFEKMDEVLEVAKKAENHTKELEKQKKDLAEDVRREQDALDVLTEEHNKTEAAHNNRLEALKQQQAKATEDYTLAVQKLTKQKQINNSSHFSQLASLTEERKAAIQKLDEEVAEKTGEVTRLETKIKQMKELARSVA